MQLSYNLQTVDTADEDQNSDLSPCLVVFVGKADCRLLKFLKSGFRHCFVAFQKNDQWIICDSLKRYIEFTVIDPHFNFNLGKFYYNQGYKVFSGYISHTKKLGWIPPELLTCVTVAKRIIGIRSFLTFTPWQLYCLLNSMKDQWTLIE